MRSIKSSLFFIISTFLVVSCSSDNPSETGENVQVIGTYTLSNVKVSPVQGVNEDCTKSSNLQDEMTCITLTLTINQDTSWHFNLVRINVSSITGGLFFIDCGDADTSGGTLTFANNQLNLNGSFELTVYSLIGDTLTRQMGDDLPGFQSVVFTK